MKQDLLKNSTLELKIAFRSLLKRPIRTFFTILAVSLGVSIFFAVNIAMDSIEQSILVHLDEEQFGYVNQWIYLLKGVFTMLSALSLFICVIIIKNLMEMTKEEELYELGLLRTVGCTKKSIFLTFFFQVLIIAIIGTLLGLIMGYFMSFLLFNPLKEMLSSFASITTEFEIHTHASVLTLLLTPLVGILIPLIFGIIPAISAGKSQVIAALNSQANNKKSKLKTRRAIIAQLIISIMLIFIGIYLVLNSFGSLLSVQSTVTTEASIATVVILVASLIFITGATILGSLILPFLAYGFSILFKPLIGKMRKICHRNLIRNSRRTKNTFLMISISLSFLIAVNIAVNSIQAGIVPGARMRYGGDVILTYSDMYHQANIPLYTAENISQIDHVEEVCEVKSSIYWNGYTFCDGFGDSPDERMGLIVINTTSYVRMHSSSIYSYKGSQSFYDFIHQLDEVGTVILQDGLLGKINKKESDLVNITTIADDYFPGISANFKVVGIMDILPGVASSWFHYEIEHYSAIISWETYFNLTESDYNTTTGNFWIKCDDPYKADIVKEDIRNLYQDLGAPWNSTYLDFSVPWIVATITESITTTREIVNLVLIVIVSILIMALVISMLGFLISMEMSVNKRKAEIGILRTIGFSKKQVIRMVLGETLIICAVSLIAGIIIGLITGFLISNVPFIAYLPLLFTVRTMDIALISLFTATLGVVASIVPAFKSTRLNIIESIKKRRV